MKLNPDCIRDLMLYLEDNLSYQHSRISINNLKLNDYTQEELLYTAEKLNEVNFINCMIADAYELPIVVVRAISFDGHQFLNTIRDNNIWNQTKSKFSKLASISIPIIQELASSIIKAKLGLP